jgi:hypothetical protein
VDIWGLFVLVLVWELLKAGGQKVRDDVRAAKTGRDKKKAKKRDKKKGPASSEKWGARAGAVGWGATVGAYTATRGFVRGSRAGWEKAKTRAHERAEARKAAKADRGAGPQVETAYEPPALQFGGPVPAGATTDTPGGLAGLTKPNVPASAASAGAPAAASTPPATANPAAAAAPAVPAPASQPTPELRVVTETPTTTGTGGDVAIERATPSGEVHTYDQLVAELTAIIKEAATDLEDAKADAKRAEEDGQRIDRMCASLAALHLDSETLGEVRALADSASARARAANDRAKAAESRHSQANRALSGLRTRHHTLAEAHAAAGNKAADRNFYKAG